MTGRRIVVRSGDPAETHAAGRAIAASLQRPFTLVLEGPLGSGKTVLAAGVCEGLGVESPVTSPTFTLHHEYVTGKGAVVHHVDCFRLSGAQEFEDLGVLDRMDSQGCLLVEWGERALAAMPPGAVRVAIQPGEGTERRIVIRVPDGVLLDSLGEEES